MPRNQFFFLEKKKENVSTSAAAHSEAVKEPI